MTRYQINPGEFRRVIVFQKNNRTKNSYNEFEDNWVDVFTTRAGIYPVSGNEFFSAETIKSEVSHKVNLRYYPGLTPDMRIKYGERTFIIISMINFQERNVLLQLMCKELI